MPFRPGNTPWNKGKKGCYSKEALQKMSVSHTGLLAGEKHPMFGKHLIPWNKGLTKENDARIRKNGENGGKTKRLRYSTGEIEPWNKGIKIDKELYPNIGHLKPHTDEMKKKMSAEFRGRHFCPRTEFKKGMRHTEEWKEQNSIRMSGSKHPNWKGGCKPYTEDFNKRLKRQIRKRDLYTCQECGYTEAKLGYRLHVHHIDFNKENNDSANLICLCQSCHGKTQWGKKDWITYYREKAVERGGL